MSESIIEKVDQALQEFRVVLPGAQALLGFQFSTLFTSVYNQLPKTIQYSHLLALILITFSTVLLVAPATYHRIKLQGQNNEQFVHYISSCLLRSIFILGFALSIDLFIALSIIGISLKFAVVLALLQLIGIYSIWFGYSIIKKDDKLTSSSRD